MKINMAGEFDELDLAVKNDHQAAREPIQHEIERRFAAHPVLRDWGLEFVCRHPSRSSDVLEYRRRDQPEAPHLIVKHRKNQMSREESGEALAGEFQTLEALRNRADGSFRESTPRPVALLREVGASVFEAVRGKPMTQLLRQRANCATGPFCRRKMSRIAREAGDWLRNFHEMTAGPVVKHDPASYFAKLSYWLGKSQSAGLGKETAARVWEAASKANGSMREEMTRKAQVHGDFIPQNILVSGNHVSVIDFESRKEPAYVHEDLGFFVAYLRLLAGSRVYSRRALMAMVDSFLEGYGDCSGRQLLNLYVLKATTTMFADQFTPGGVNSAGSERVRYITAQLERAARDL